MTAAKHKAQSKKQNKTKKQTSIYQTIRHDLLRQNTNT